MRFSLSCGAAKFLLKRRNIPILGVIRVTERKRNIMFAAIVRLFHSWKNYHRSLNELNRLGDRELADIGISRSDIPRLAWTAAHR
jgi:uncharacterized protein YjiS (DUF1127 family)